MTSRSVTLALLAVAVAVVGLGIREPRLLAALVLPSNLELTLHALELGLFLLLAADLGWRHYRRRSPALMLRTVDGQDFGVHGTLVFGTRPGRGGVTLPGPQVSRRHLEVRRADGGLEARDAGSTNGTFLGGDDLRERAEPVTLAAGDRLELGRGGPTLECVAAPVRGLLATPLRLAAWLGLLWSGLFLGWRANLAHLPATPLDVGGVSVDFTAFVAAGPLAMVGLAATLAGAAYFLAPRRAASSEAADTVQILLALGLLLLYPLLPAVAQRYARAAERAFTAVESTAGAGTWGRLELAEASGRTADVAPSVQRRYERGRASLRWATNLAARADEPLYAITYFRQSFLLIAAVFIGLAVPRWFPAAGDAAAALVARLRRPLSRRLIRAADHGRPLARWLRPLAYGDVVSGFLAAAVVAVTLWSPFGTSLGRGRSLYLTLPGVPPVQSVEIVKALFVLFVAGYFARQGPLLARVARRRYLVPYVLAALGTLALTGVQADLGGLFMLGLFLGLVFVAVTGQLRLVLWVPMLLLPALGLAALLGLTSVMTTRFGIWFAARTHPLGEQLVQARQLLLSSGWLGFPPRDQLAWKVPDVQGDLAFAAFGERFGLLGLLALIGCWYVLMASLLRAARRTAGGAAILLTSVAALVLVQVLTQTGGLMGLLPLTGVPLPWMSHGLTASLVFTGLIALALAAGAAPATGSGVAALRYLARAHRAAMAGLALLAVAWVAILPLGERFGPHGRHYRWEDVERRARVEAWIAEGLFEPAGRHREVRPSAAGRHHPRSAQIAATADGLRVDGDGIRPLDYLVANPNLFADRAGPRGAVVTRDGTAVALSGERDRRVYPLGEVVYHPVGYAGPLARASGVEAAARPYLAGADLSWQMRLRRFESGIRSGPDLVLTLDAELQETAFEALAGRPGAAVVMDLHDGALLALASSPAVDPGTADLDEWRAFTRRDDQPLRDRALRATDVYSPPGSVFKIVVAAAILESGEVDPRETLICRGRDATLRVTCAHGHAHGRVDLARALVESCNIYFARATVRLGADPVVRVAERFGFNERRPPNLLAGVPGAELRPGFSQVDAGGVASERDLARVGYGQGPVAATPLQVARMGAVVATGGELLDPVLARALALTPRDRGRAAAVWRRELAPGRRQRALPEEVVEAMRAPLTRVFTSPRGTARRLDRLWWSPEDGWRLAARAPADGWRGVELAGKTGSAWKTRRDPSDDSWMVVWAPAAAPRLVVSVLVEDAGEGGKVAGPIALRLLRQGLEAVRHEP